MVINDKNKGVTYFANVWKRMVATAKAQCNTPDKIRWYKANFDFKQKSLESKHCATVTYCKILYMCFPL